MAEDIQYPQFSADGLPLTYIPDPFKADGKPVSGQWKEPVRVYTDGDITLSGLQIINGVSVMEGDRVLVKDQINTAENGIWIASAGAWQRARDMYLWPQFVSAVVAVEENTGPGLEVWITEVASSGTVDTTPVFWVPVTAATGTIPVFTPLRALVTNVVGEPQASPTTAVEIAFLSGVTSAVQEQFQFLYNQAGAAFSIAVDGTNAAANAQSTADTALSTANSAWAVAQIGTNTGTAALAAAATAQSTADSAFSIAVQGTNAAAVAQSTADAAYTLAEAGTDIGSLAYTVATALGDKYVRTTRFASIGAGTGGTVTLPPNSTVVLDDFGGGVDAVISTISAGYPTFQHAFTAAGALVTTSFDGAGNYTLSGAPSAYPVAIVYRVRQRLSEFDSTSTDIIGSYDLEGVESVQGTVNQVYVNGSLGAQYGVLTLGTPQDIAPTSSPTFVNLTLTGSVSVAAGNVTAVVGTQDQVLANGAFGVNTTGTVTLTTPQSIAPTSAVTFGSVYASGTLTSPYARISEAADLNHIHFDLNAGTVARQTGCLRWNANDATLDLDMVGTSVTLQVGQETLLYARNNSGADILNGKAVYISGATGDVPTIALANNTVRVQSRSCVGVATEYIANGARGYVCLLGLVRDVDTSGYIAGRALFLGTSGNLTMTPPTQPASAVFVGVVCRVNVNNGIIYVDPRPTDSLSELQDVYIPTRQVGDHLVYNGTVWVNEAGTTSAPQFQVSTVTAGTTIVPAVPHLRRVYLADSTSGTVVVALPNATGWTGEMVYVKKISSDGNRVFVRSATGTATVDGSLQQFFTVQYTAMQVTTDGNNWYIL